MSTVIIQAGHCHRRTGSTGTRSQDGYTEQQFTWSVSNAAAALLKRDGHDARVILADPASSAQYRGDVFVAIHADGNNSPKVKGASVGYRTNEGKALAHAWKAAYKALGWSHGFRGDNYTPALGGYYGTKRAVAQGNRRACILEFGFLTNPTEVAELRSSAGQARAAQSVRRAVNAVLGQSTPDDTEDEFDMTPEEREQLLDDIAERVQLKMLVEDTKWLDWRISFAVVGPLKASVYAARDTLASLIRRITGTLEVDDSSTQHDHDRATGIKVQGSADS